VSHTEKVVAILGGRKALGRNAPESERDFIPLVRSGVPFRAFEAASRELDVSLRDLEQIGIPMRTLTRRRQQKSNLSPTESERFLRLVRVSARAEEILGDRDAARSWVREPNRALGGATPFQMLDTDVGLGAVLDVLGRIEHGVYS
jgi:putative toxin-antitoxin system antitoxin component (TIGR02293 family)